MVAKGAGGGAGGPAPFLQTVQPVLGPLPLSHLPAQS